MPNNRQGFNCIEKPFSQYSLDSEALQTVRLALNSLQRKCVTTCQLIWTSNWLWLFFTCFQRVFKELVKFLEMPKHCQKRPLLRCSPNSFEISALKCVFTVDFSMCPAFPRPPFFHLAIRQLALVFSHNKLVSSWLIVGYYSDYI